MALLESKIIIIIRRRRRRRRRNRNKIIHYKIKRNANDWRIK